MQGKWGMLTYYSYSMNIKEGSHNTIDDAQKSLVS